MTKVKVCGLRSYENALMVAEAGADLIGLNFYPDSPRFIDAESAGDLVKRLRARLGDHCPVLVGIFVNESAARVREAVASVGLDYAQLSGDEPPETLAELSGVAFKGIRPKTAEAALGDADRYANAIRTDGRMPSLLLDAFNPSLYGGTGETTALDVALALREVAPRLMLAGGLNPENVAERVRAIRPWGLDVASGVEAGIPGLKDEDKVRAFITEVRNAG
ncbi:MAG: phosphoribosylanthranilate isomerase [Chloroflexota bacterium]|nr:phosphoribosylanthranilate isomerase [Chloroflexota bacterium]MDE2858541.1 phosphoribosylanthranilate isomerase [Chloroflexota bacterium]